MEKGDIMFSGSRGNMFLQRIVGRRIFLKSTKGILKLSGGEQAEERKSHVMVTLKGWFKGETGDKWHMLLLVDIMYSVIEVRIWLYLDSG